MGLLDFFRSKPPIRNMSAVATFVDENAAFLMQKGLYEFARARSGHYAKVLFGEPEFQHAIEVARWRAYPLGLVIVGGLVVSQFITLFITPVIYLYLEDFQEKVLNRTSFFHSEHGAAAIRPGREADRSETL